MPEELNKDELYNVCSHIYDMMKSFLFSGIDDIKNLFPEDNEIVQQVISKFEELDISINNNRSEVIHIIYDEEE